MLGLGLGIEARSRGRGRARLRDRGEAAHLVGHVVARHGVEVCEQGEALLLEELAHVRRLQRLLTGGGLGLGG